MSKDALIYFLLALLLAVNGAAIFHLNRCRLHRQSVESHEFEVKQLQSLAPTMVAQIIRTNAGLYIATGTVKGAWEPIQMSCSNCDTMLTCPPECK